jgi:hypothetical protein
VAGIAPLVKKATSNVPDARCYDGKQGLARPKGEYALASHHAHNQRSGKQPQVSTGHWNNCNQDDERRCEGNGDRDPGRIREGGEQPRQNGEQENERDRAAADVRSP